MVARRGIAIGCALMLASASVLYAAASSDGNALLADASDGADWPGYGRTYGEQHYSPLDQVNDRTVGGLGLAWSMDLPPGNSVSQPLAVDGVLYFATFYSVVRAVDAKTGKLLWTFDAKAPEVSGRKLRQGWGSRGLAYWQGKVFTAAHDGRLIAIDARTGKQIWSSQTLGPKEEDAYMSGAPRVFDGKVIIGFGGGDAGNVRGYVSTYDTDTGKLLWRFYTVPGNPADGFEDETQAMAAKTWAGEWWKWGGGGNVWNAFTYDADTDTILMGTGNGHPWNHRVRSEGKGDNLFIASIVALDAKTGKYRWHYQVNPGESWDYNASMDIHLAELTIEGQRRKVAITAPKNGFLYVIDRLTGKLLSAEKIARVSWASHIDMATGRPVEHPDARYPDGKTFVMQPSPVGAHNAAPSAFSPKTGLVYIPRIEFAMSYNDRGINPRQWKPAGGNAIDGAVSTGFEADAGPDNGTSELLAWNPVTQTPVWKVPNRGTQNGGLMVTGGNLVFQGKADGRLEAYDATTGKLLWSFATQAPVIAAPISYSVAGRQYVSVLTGMGASAALISKVLPAEVDYRTQKRRVLTFALGGKAKLPVAVPAKLVAVDDPEFRRDADTSKRGSAVYYLHCVFCHGVEVSAAGIAPDLRTSPFILSGEGFEQVVRKGVLVPQGMPDFPEFNDGQLADLRQYLREKAADWRMVARP